VNLQKKIVIPTQIIDRYHLILQKKFLLMTAWECKRSRGCWHWIF